MAVDAKERLGLVVSALAGVRDESPFGLAAACALLESRDLTPEQARLRLDAERIILEGIVAKGRGRKAGPSVSPVAPEPAGEPGVPAPMPGGGRYIRKGDAGDHISAMQVRLTEMGHAVGRDGKFGDRELRAVKAVQKQFGVPQTGVVDTKTLEAMRIPPTPAAHAATGLRSALLAVGQTSGPGDAGPHVAALHQALMGIGHEIADPEQTFGSSTATAVRSVQHENGLAPTGRADEQTIALISRIAAAPAPETKKKPSAKGDSMKTKVKEATYADDSGVESPYGGIDPAVARTARILALKPPNLREAPSAAFDACASCVFFGGGSSGCEKYGGYPVDRDDICDDWKTLTPAANRPTRKKDEGTSELLGDALDGIDPGKIKEAISTRRRERIAGAGHAMAGGRYPIETAGDLENAVKDWIRTGRPADVAAWIRKSAKRLGVATPDALQEAGVPTYVARIARHLHYEKGKSIGEAIAIAMNVVKRWSLTGASEETKARAVASLEEWREKARAEDPAALSEAQLDRVSFEEAEADFGLALALYESAFKAIPPSARFSAKLLADVERSYDDWGRWTGGSPPVEATATMTIYAQEAALAAAPGYSPDPTLSPFVREVGGKAILFVAGVPVRLFESYGEASGAEAAAQSYDAMSRSKNTNRTKKRVAKKVRKGFHPGASEHNRADLHVHARVSSRFAGVGAIVVPVPVPVVAPDADGQTDGDMDADDLIHSASFSSAGGHKSLLEVAEGIVGGTSWETRVMEAVDSMEKATVHSPIGKPDGPGLWKHKGMQLPAYIQHIAKALMKDGHPESEAIGMAVGIVKRWARGGGKVDANTRAAAAKAVSEWEAAKASAHAKTAAKAVKEAEEVEESFTALFNPIRHPRGRGGKFKDVLDHIATAAQAEEPRPQLGQGENDMASKVAGYGKVLPQELKAGDHFRDGVGGVYHVQKTEAGRAGKVKLHLAHDIPGVGPTHAGAYSFEPVDQGFRRHTVEPGRFDAKPPVTATDDAVTVDKAIGNLLTSYPGLEDWNVDRMEQPAGWHVHVTMPGAAHHHFHVSDEGTVGMADESGKPKGAQQAPKPVATPKAAAPAAATAHGYELTGEHEKPYHMVNGQVFQGKKGGWFQKLDSGKMTSEKGWQGAGVHVHDLATGDKKWVPAFAMKDHLPLAGAPGSFKKPEPPQGTDDLFSELMSSVKPGDGVFAGKNVVVTGKIPGYTREDVHGMIGAEGGVAHSSVGKDTHVLLTGDKVGATKINAAKAKGVKVVPWDSVKHLLEAEITPRLRRLLSSTAELAEAATPADSAGVSARIAALDGQLTKGERTQLARIRPSGLARFGVVEESVATMRRRG